MILRILPVLLLAILAFVLWSSGLVQHVSIAGLVDGRDMLQDLIARRPIVAMGAFLLVYIGLAAMAFPISPLLSISSGFLFGPVPGVLVSVTGATLGGALLFLAARIGFAGHLRDRLGPRLQALAAGFHRDAVGYMLFMRVAIVFPSWFVNIGTGLLNLRLSTFLWTTAVGILPVTFAFAFAGAGLDKALAAQIENWRACPGAQGWACAFEGHPLSLLQPELIAALLVLAGISLLSVFLRRRWRVLH